MNLTIGQCVALIMLFGALFVGYRGLRAVQSQRIRFGWFKPRSDYYGSDAVKLGRSLMLSSALMLVGSLIFLFGSSSRHLGIGLYALGAMITGIRMRFWMYRSIGGDDSRDPTQDQAP